MYGCMYKGKCGQENRDFTSVRNINCCFTCCTAITSTCSCWHDTLLWLCLPSEANPTHAVAMWIWGLQSHQNNKWQNVENNVAQNINNYEDWLYLQCEWCYLTHQQSCHPWWQTSGYERESDPGICSSCMKTKQHIRVQSWGNNIGHISNLEMTFEWSLLTILWLPWKF